MVKQLDVDLSEISWQQIRNILKNEVYVNVVHNILMNPDLPTQIMNEIMSDELIPATFMAKHYLLQNRSLPDNIIENVVNGMYIKDPNYSNYSDSLGLNPSVQRKHLDVIAVEGSFDLHNKIIETGNPSLTREHISLMFNKSKSYQMCRNLSSLWFNHPELVEKRIVEEIFYNLGKLLFTPVDYTHAQEYFVNLPHYRTEIAAFMKTCLVMNLNVAAYTIMLTKVADEKLRKILLRQIRKHPKYSNYPNDWLNVMFPYMKPENIT